MEHCEGNFASFHRLFQPNVKASLSVFLGVSAGGFSAGGKSPAAQSTVSHVSLPCPGHPGPLPAPGCRQAAGHQREVHNHHPSNRYGSSASCPAAKPACPPLPPCWEASTVSCFPPFCCPLEGLQQLNHGFCVSLLGPVCGSCLGSNVVYQKIIINKKSEALFTLPFASCPNPVPATAAV